MFILLWIVASIVGYLFIAGVLRTPFAKVSARRCLECKDGRHLKVWKEDYRDHSKWVNAEEYHGSNGSAQAAFWPFTLPWTAGSMISDSDRANKKEAKAIARRKDEIAEAKHQAELAAIRAEEDAHLTRQLQDK